MTVTMKDVLREMLTKPNLILATGFPGSGKTFTCEELCAWVLLNHGFVISNVKLLKWDEEKNRPVQGEYPNYLMARSFVEVLDAIAEILYNNPAAHILLYIDEAQNSFDALAFAGTMGRTIKKFLGLMRKFSVTTLLSSPRKEWLLTVIKDQDVGLLTVEFLKDPNDLEKYASDFMDRWDLTYKQTAVMNWPSQGIFFKPLEVPIAPILAIPEDIARKEHKVYFDTGAVGSLEYGKHPLTGKPVDFGILLSLLDAEGIVSYDYPRVLYEYFRIMPTNQQPQPLPPHVKDDPSKSVDSKGGTSSKKGIKDQVESMIHGGARAKDVMETTGSSERYYYETKSECRKLGHVT